MWLLPLYALWGVPVEGGEGSENDPPGGGALQGGTALGALAAIAYVVACWVGSIPGQLGGLSIVGGANMGMLFG